MALCEQAKAGQPGAVTKMDDQKIGSCKGDCMQGRAECKTKDLCQTDCDEAMVAMLDGVAIGVLIVAAVFAVPLLVWVYSLLPLP